MELIAKPEAKDKVLHLQRKLYRWSKEETFELKRIYNLIYNPYVLSAAWHRLRSRNGSRTPGTDEITIKTIENKIGPENWLTMIQDKLRNRTFRPDTIRRAFIEKEGKSEKRPLGIPTLEDRLVQTSLKIILEPIFEARFKGCSVGFRPSRGPIHANSMVRNYMRPYNRYEWVIEADIRNCFGNIDHGILLKQIKKTVPDKRVVSLIKGFLKAGILEEGNIHLPVTGSPQGGVISPLLANIYLDQLDEVYHRRFHSMSHPDRQKHTKQGKTLCRFIRYADDFIILVRGNREQAEEEFRYLQTFVQDELKMELAEEKSGVHSLFEGFDFLGYNFRRGKSLRTRRVSTIILPSKEATIRFRRKVKELTTRATLYQEPDELLQKLNYLIRGWGEYFRYGWVSVLFRKLDYYVDYRVARWLKNKHQRQPKKKLRRHKRRYWRGSWKWIRRKYRRRDITGRLKWTGNKYSLDQFNQLFPMKRAPWPRYDAITPYNCEEVTRQMKLTGFITGHKTLFKAESLLQRHRNW